MTDTEYNGWRNHATWNVALWISNDEGLCHIAKECKDYETFVEHMREIDCDVDHIGVETPDKVAWNDTGLDLGALDRMMAEL